MTKSTIKSVLTAAAVLCAMTSQLGFAATLRASASLDWAGLVVSFLPDGLNALRSEDSSSTSICGSPNCIDGAFAPDWSSPISTAITTPLLDASAAADATSLGANVDLHGDVAALLSLQVRSEDFLFFNQSANALRNAVFHVSGGAGFMLVAIPAVVSVEILDWTNDAGASVQASARIGLSKVNGTFSEGSLLKFASGCSECGFDGNGTVSDTIVAALRVNDGDEVFFSAQVSSAVDTSRFSPVPLPAGAYLLAGALGGLLAARRRRAV